MEWLILLVLVAGILAFLAKGKVPVSKDFPYRLESSLFTPAERSFYGVLCQVTAGNAIVFAKVRVADVLRTVKGLPGGDRQKAFNRISAKHFDFILCDPKDLSVLSAIELDDKSHNKKKRADRDEFIDGACAAAGLTLHRFRASSGYKINEVREKLSLPPTAEPKPALAPTPEKHREINRFAPPSKGVAQQSKTLCPKCSSELVKRVASKGKREGEEFMACSAFPKCRYVAEIEVIRNSSDT